MKLKRLTACALSAIMLVTSVSFGGYGISYVTAAEQNTNLIQKKTVQEVAQTILADNAKANSEQTPPPGKGGSAAWAFDEVEHWWHSRFQGDRGDGEVASGFPSETNPIWIQTGFGEAKQIKKLTYQARTDNQGGIINKYKVMVANKAEGEPTDADFREVASGNFANNMNEQTILLPAAVEATHIRLVAYSVHAKAGNQPYATARRIRVYEEVNAEGFYDTNKEKDYWDYETYNGTLGQQTESDVWSYQIKANGTWSNLPESAFHDDAWMNNSSSAADSTYWWAKLGRGNITSSFKGGAGHEALAFTWKAQKAGYYKAGLEENITTAADGSKSLDCRVWHAAAGSNEDGELLHQIILANGGTFTSKIAKVNAGDLIRIGAVVKDAWANNFLPMVVEVSAKDYAVQYLAEVADVENGNYTAASRQAVENARTALTEATQAEVPNMEDIETKITALETAIAGLKPAVESVTLNKTELALTIGGSETLTVTVAPETTDQEVLWESDQPEIASVENGVVTAKKAGVAVIKVSSVDNPAKYAECTVTVSRDDTALDAAIAEAKAKMEEPDYAQKYTQASKDALANALELAEAAKKDTQMSPEEVKLAVENLQAAIAGLELKAVVTIINNGETETRYCEVGEQVKVVAEKVDGKKFSHWTFNGTPICYVSPYTFTVYGNTEIQAVYVDAAAEIEKQVNVLCNVSYANGKVKFFSKHSVPADAGYKVLRAGVVATDSTGYTAIQNAGQQLNLETTATTRLKKYGVNTNYYLANFTQYLKTSRATTWYARGYVTYQDNEGVQHTVYSNVAEYTIH